MMSTSCLSFLLVLFVLANATQDWQKFKATHGKSYVSASEEAKRKELFMKADLTIKKHNSENHTWKMKHSLFSDMTATEKKNLLGLDAPKNLSPPLSNRTTIKYKYDPDAVLPANLDYRNDPCMAPVKGQGACGSCWAFSAVNPMEFANCKNRNNKLTIFSEQQLLDCVYPRSGCNGGSPFNAYDYFINNNVGVASEAAYPYTAKYAKCKSSKALNEATVDDWRWAWPDLEWNWQKISKYMMQVLNRNVTIATAIFVTDELGSYGSGVYTNTTNCDISVNHGVVIVGYGTLNAIDYWIVRNSWGPEWGDNGYIKMRRGVNQCRIERIPLYPTMV